MISSRACPDHRLVLVRYSGEVREQDAAKWVEEAAAELKTMAIGFRLLVDMTGLTAMDVECAPFIERVMDMCQERGVADIVRVIPNPSQDIGMQIMSSFHYSPSVRIGICATLEEAIALLAGKDPVDQALIRSAVA